MKIVLFAAAIAAVALSMTAAVAQDRSLLPSSSIRVAQAASSCSAWKTICDSRGPGCDAKFNQCMKSGCWVEGQQYGGAKHCGLAKR
jgi:invasion protein IalB